MRWCGLKKFRLRRRSKKQGEKMIPTSVGSIKNSPEKKGLIFDIQKYSVQDGPGVRTLVFFKGCHLRCKWCSNPEGMNPYPELMWVEAKCIHCGKCLNTCRNGVLSVNDRGGISVDYDKCLVCGDCTQKCYAQALKMTGRYVTVDEIMPLLESDRAYYESSGGGITLGGGDPLYQPAFAKELLMACKEYGFDTAVETTACFKWETIEDVMGYVDTFLIDLKGMDDEMHIANTGVSNKIILSNIEKLSECGANICIRVPVVPGYNSSESNITATAKFAAKLPTHPKVALLPYFNLGMSKYEQLGRIYPTRNVVPPEEEYMEKLRTLVKKNSFKIL